MKCFGCGVEKDLAVLETYPFEDVDNTEPIDPLFVVVCNGTHGCRACVVCHQCFHKLDPDLWINETIWSSIGPLVPYEKLPVLDHTNPNVWQPSTYQE